MIRLRQVTRRYGHKVAVDQLDLDIPQGELFAFLGPNGAGKTTTIKMMVGLLQPHAGQVCIGGFDVATQAREANHRTGYVPDEPYLYDKLTGREFLQFVANLYGLSGTLAAERMAEQIETFALSDFVDHLTESYSHGMKQRLVFASALLHDPAVLIVDEPMVGLDPRSMRLVKDLLRDKARRGTTVFMSTHTLPIAEEIADRIGVFMHGRLRFLGTMEEMRRTMARDASLEHLFLALTADGGDMPAEPTVTEADGS